MLVALAENKRLCRQSPGTGKRTINADSQGNAHGDLKNEARSRERTTDSQKKDDETNKDT
jgi:hypothetical protein